MKLIKKMAALGLIGILLVGQSVSVLAEIEDVFTVGAPGCSLINGRYSMTGACSVTGHTYYMQDVVEGFVTSKDVDENRPKWKGAGYGYNAAAAWADGDSKEPYQVNNTGYYGGGGGFTKIKTKKLINE